jgi:hypothetical protein
MKECKRCEVSLYNPSRGNTLHLPDTCTVCVCRLTAIPVDSLFLYSTVILNIMYTSTHEIMWNANLRLLYHLHPTQ